MAVSRCSNTKGWCDPIAKGFNLALDGWARSRADSKQRRKATSETTYDGSFPLAMPAVGEGAGYHSAAGNHSQDCLVAGIGNGIEESG